MIDLQETPISYSLDQEAMLEVVENMYELMFMLNGVGLAGPQVSILEPKLCIVHPQIFPTIPSTLLIEPKIIKDYWQKSFETEGCLSYPGVFLPKERSKRVTIEAKDIHGRAFTFQARGFAALILQHEIDHLNDKIIF